MFKYVPRILGFVCAVVFAFAAASAQEPIALDAAARTPFTFVAYGDLRETNPANIRDSDPVRRKELIDAIAQLNPAFILVSGDLPLRGDNPADWAQWDKETQPWRAANISVYPALGNHDLRGDLNVALNNYFQRFPALKRNRYYSVRAANLLILTLDSSMDQPGTPQMQWLDAQLNNLPSDVDFVVFNMHHPPYTNSSDRLPTGGHTERPTEHQLGKHLEDIQQHTRARFLVFAGHVHNYERYEHGGVMYIVTGGAGASPYVIPRGPDDFYRDPGPTYHYCALTVDKGRLDFSMVKLEMQGDKATYTKRDSFTLSASKAAAAHGR